jgi:hypothetical protein
MEWFGKLRRYIKLVTNNQTQPTNGRKGVSQNGSGLSLKEEL